MENQEIYNWQIALHLKQSLEDAARNEEISLAQLLERIVLEWLTQRSQSEDADEDTQQRLQQSAARAFGTIHSGDPDRSQEINQRIKDKLRSSF